MNNRIILLAVAVILALVYTRIFENTFFKEIILVGIPTVIGVYTTKSIYDSWQKRKDAGAIKRRILEEYAQSFGNEYSMLGEFARMIYNKYLDYSVHSDTFKDEIKFKSKFPTDANLLPGVAYKNEWNKFDDKIWKNTYIKKKFLANFELYNKDERLSLDITRMDKMMHLCHQRVAVLVHSKNRDEFERTYNKIQVELDKIQSVNKSIGGQLAKKNFKMRLKIFKS